jgi:hypothetical protein
MALLALLVLPQVTQAAPQHSPSNNNDVNLHLTFAALINEGVGSGTAYVGGLNLQFDHDNGGVKGTLNLPGNEHLPVTGTIDNGQITLYIFLDQHTFIKAQGTFDGIDTYSGTFNEYINENQVASGIWSASLIDQPSEVTTYAYHLTITTGPYIGAYLDAVLVINNQTGIGNAYEANGLVTPFTFAQTGSHVTMVFYLPDDIQIFDQGILSGNYMAGTSTSTVGGGVWYARRFHL